MEAQQNYLIIIDPSLPVEYLVLNNNIILINIQMIEKLLNQNTGHEQSINSQNDINPIR